MLDHEVKVLLSEEEVDPLYDGRVNLIDSESLGKLGYPQILTSEFLGSTKI